MKDKTHEMNRGYSKDMAEAGCEILPNSEIASARDRKNRQLKWANLDDNEAMTFVENTREADEDHDIGGFLPRNNYEDRD